MKSRFVWKWLFFLAFVGHLQCAPKPKEEEKVLPTKDAAPLSPEESALSEPSPEPRDPKKDPFCYTPPPPDLLDCHPLLEGAKGSPVTLEAEAYPKADFGVWRLPLPPTCLPSTRCCDLVGMLCGCTADLKLLVSFEFLSEFRTPPKEVWLQVNDLRVVKTPFFWRTNPYEMHEFEEEINDEIQTNQAMKESFERRPFSRFRFLLLWQGAFVGKEFYLRGYENWRGNKFCRTAVVTVKIDVPVLYRK